jgi:hypothetical protein
MVNDAYTVYRVSERVPLGQGLPEEAALEVAKRNCAFKLAQRLMDEFSNESYVDGYLVVTVELLMSAVRDLPNKGNANELPRTD